MQVEKNEKELDRAGEGGEGSEKPRMDEPEERKPRTIEDMAEEANQLRVLVQQDCKKND